MAKKFSRLVSIVLGLSVFLTFSITNSAVAIDGNSNVSIDLSTQHIIEPLTKIEEQESEKKLNEAKKYVANKRKNQQSTGNIIPYSYGSSKVLSYSFPAYAQEQSTWCGPAAAFNAIKYVGAITVDYLGNPLSQATLASDTWLKTVSSGGQTTFGSNWTSTMNGWAPGNNYARMLASNYGSNWESTFLNSVIWTIDKGYPVIADTKQHIGASSTNLSSNYATDWYNNKDTYHYVVICGYDDVNKKILFSDSHSSFPGLYWISVRDMASLTDDFGLVW
ncbi:MAG: C39 family peptidase [Desulfitobacterium sp.]